MTSEYIHVCFIFIEYIKYISILYPFFIHLKLQLVLRSYKKIQYLRDNGQGSPNHKDLNKTSFLHVMWYYHRQKWWKHHFKCSLLILPISSHPHHSPVVCVWEWDTGRVKPSSSQIRCSQKSAGTRKQRLALENCLPLKDLYSPLPSCWRCV